MHDRQRTKKNVKFYDFDLSKIEKQDDPHILFFERPNPVVVLKHDERMQVFVSGCIIEIGSPTHLTHEQYILTDLFSKGLYYKNISKYKNFKTFLLSLKSFKENPDKRTKEFVETLKNAVDGKIEKIEISRTGKITTHETENLSVEENKEK